MRVACVCPVCVCVCVCVSYVCVCVLCVCVGVYLCLHMRVFVFVHVIYCFKHSQVIVGESVCLHYSSMEMCAVDEGGVCRMWQAS